MARRASNLRNVVDLDSMTHFNLMTAVERRYTVRFALGELRDLNGAGGVSDLLCRKPDAK